MSSATIVQRYNETVLADLEMGDMVEFDRGIYFHWAVYIGESKVIHLRGDDNGGMKNVRADLCFTICGKKFNKAVVDLEDFWDVTQGCKAYKNNGKDKQMTPDRRDVIVSRAKSMLGMINYNVLWSNCEHFASYCRYGKEKSEQSERFTFFAAGVAVLSMFAAVIFGGSRKRRDADQPQPY